MRIDCARSGISLTGRIRAIFPSCTHCQRSRRTIRYATERLMSPADFPFSCRTMTLRAIFGAQEFLCPATPLESLGAVRQPLGAALSLLWHPAQPFCRTSDKSTAQTHFGNARSGW
jgi:hypothetical protein